VQRGIEVTDVNNFFYGDGRMPDLKYDQILEKLEQIIMENAELFALVTALPAQMEKVKDEITAKIAAMETALGADVPTEVVAALEAVKASLDGLDAIVPDAPVAATPVDAPNDAPV